MREWCSRESGGEIAGRVVVITGASQGIGETMAREFARRGGAVVVAARNAERLQRLADAINAEGRRAPAMSTDVRHLEEIERLVQATSEAFGGIDALINNAGIATPRVGLMETEDDDLRAMVEINLLGPMRCARAVAPQMRGRGGVIVNIGSIAGEIALGDVYSATKSAVRGYTDDLRRAVRRDGIAVVLVEPGFIRTTERPLSRLPMPGPETAARAIVRAVERPRRTIIVPWPYRIPVIAARLFPGVVDRIIGRRNFRQVFKGGEPEASGDAPPA